MIASLLLILGSSVSSAQVAQPPTPASASVTPAAQALFERDWVLMNWALKFHDADRDIFLSPAESQSAANAFRAMADSDHDGRITPQEYRAARELILSRY